MKIKNLSYRNFRNLKDFDIEVSPGITILKGQNAQGKTNFLESIYVLALTKSFRTMRTHDLISWERDYFRISGETLDEEGESGKSEVFFEQKPLKRSQFKLNNAAIPAKDYVGSLSTVTFIPDDLNIITGSPRHRRRYLDILLSQIDRNYLYVLSDYQKALKERNALLHLIYSKKANINELEFWDDKIVSLGIKIMEQRKELIDFFNKNIEEIVCELTNKKISLKINYAPSIKWGEEAIKDTFHDHLVAHLDSDIQNKTTRKGPHRDDFEIMQENHILGIYGSRGEIRTGLLALKMCELKYFSEHNNINPILLLDDVFSELDNSRQDALLKILREHQSIVTTTDHFEDKIEDAAVFEVKNGVLTVK